MPQLTKNFHSSEFDCRDGTLVPISLQANVEELAKNLQVLRDEIGEPLHINSAYRHAAYNKKIVLIFVCRNQIYPYLYVSKLSVMVCCSKCGQVITEVVTINGKPFGTTCALHELGIADFPSWFKGGDYSKAKSEYDAKQADLKAAFEESKVITAEAWSEWCLLSKAIKTAHRGGNEWAMNFISSIIHQLGYFTSLAEVNHPTMQEAEKNWSPASGGFPYLHKRPRPISALSAKQKSILDKYL